MVVDWPLGGKEGIAMYDRSKVTQEERAKETEQAKAESVLSDSLCNDPGFLKKVIKAQARLLVAYRIGGKPPEWVFDTIEKAQKAGIEC